MPRRSTVVPAPFVTDVSKVCWKAPLAGRVARMHTPAVCFMNAQLCRGMRWRSAVPRKLTARADDPDCLVPLKVVLR
jgi:hypothetical protein